MKFFSTQMHKDMPAILTIDPTALFFYPRKWKNECYHASILSYVEDNYRFFVRELFTYHLSFVSRNRKDRLLVRLF